MRQGRGASLALVFFLLGTGCVGSPPVGDALGLSASLRERGITVEVAGDPVQQPFFAVAGTALDVAEGQVQVFEYADAATAAAQATRVAPDGSTIGTSKIHWLAPPRFYRAGRLIVLCIGADARVHAALRELLGPPFAGAGG